MAPAPQQHGSALLVAAFLLCFSIVSGHDHHSSSDVLNATEATVSKAKSHVSHMLQLQPLPNADKVAAVVANETLHLAHEIRQLEQAFKNKLPSEGAELGQIAATLDQPGTGTGTGANLEEANSKYFGAVDKVLDQLKRVQGQDDVVKPLVNGALNGLSHDVDNYQYGIHKEVGAHEGQEHGNHYVPHAHHAGSSSEESSEEAGAHHHHHHHHRRR